MRIGKALDRFRSSPESPKARSGADPANTAQSPDETVQSFHRMYYDSMVWRDTYWQGVETEKTPLDLWIYQEIIFEMRPDVIVETGTFDGGSALYLATMCDLVGSGKVITVDIETRPYRPKHPRITYVEGHSSTSVEAVTKVRAGIGGAPKVMVILDSDHGMLHVQEELKVYSGMVTPGQYLIVEDTNINGHPVQPQFGPGPMEAVDDFLREAKDFEIDPSREKFYLTFNPRGFLKKR
jgi:cephalosporin hydroxylase